jgi:cation diffusion facilitator CzcD-associated flavoprotein CzcO
VSRSNLFSQSTFALTVSVHSFNTFVESAERDGTAGVWNIKTKGGDLYQCKYLVLCTGCASKHYIPAYRGLDKFKGITSHTAVWPQKGIDIKGKRVGVIGTGASGVQIIQPSAA